MRLYLKFAVAMAVTAITAETVSADRYVVDTGSPRQSISHFGASDAWAFPRIGAWPDEQQEQIADWLFSLETDDKGNPLGIGLSLWRFNLGAGSYEQGDSSMIRWERRTECMLRPDGTWDYTKQMPQRHFLKLAKERGVPYFLAFLNSAPVQFTDNGLATNYGRGGSINLRDDCYDDFADYMAKSLKAIETHDGIRFNYISPVNEPDINWLDTLQEGSAATNREIGRLVKELDKALDRHRLSTEIIVMEVSNLKNLIGRNEHTPFAQGYALQQLFTPDSAAYIDNLRHVPGLIVGHSYWTNTPVTFMASLRRLIRQKCDSLGVGFWQSEYCIMDNDEEIGRGPKFDFTMTTALYVARLIHHDLVMADARSWSWWRGAGEDYKNGLLRIYSNDTKRTGWAVDSKLLWSLGNFSRFIRPGAVRHEIVRYDESGAIVADGDTEPYGIMCSAYRNTDGSWVVVAINYSEEVKPFHIEVPGMDGHKWTMYRTSDIASENLAKTGTVDRDTRLAPRSVSTFVMK